MYWHASYLVSIGVVVPCLIVVTAVKKATSLKSLVTQADSVLFKATVWLELRRLV